MLSSPRLSTQRILTAIVALACAPASLSQSLPAAQSPAETNEAAVQRLRKLKPAELRNEDRALLAGLEFCLAVDAADGKRAASLVDPSGYHPLPSDGPLPQRPQKPLFAPALPEQISKRTPRRVAGTCSTAGLRVLRQKELRDLYPAMAKWMLTAEDYALVLDAASNQTWLTREACLVIRVRGSRAYVMGGNLLEAIGEK